MSVKDGVPNKTAIACCSRNFLRWLSYLVMVQSILGAFVIFMINDSPTYVGWMIIAVCGISFISGILGCISAGQTGCFYAHVVSLVVSVFSLAASAAVAFIKTSLLLHHLHFKRSRYAAGVLTRAGAALFLLTICVQITTLVMALVVHCFRFIDFYEDEEVRRSTIEDARRSSVSRTSADPILQSHLSRSSNPSMSPIFQTQLSKCSTGPSSPSMDAILQGRLSIGSSRTSMDPILQGRMSMPSSDHSKTTVGLLPDLRFSHASTNAMVHVLQKQYKQPKHKIHTIVYNC